MHACLKVLNQQAGTTTDRATTAPWLQHLSRTQPPLRAPAPSTDRDSELRAMNWWRRDRDWPWVLFLSRRLTSNGDSSFWFPASSSAFSRSTTSAMVVGIHRDGVIGVDGGGDDAAAAPAPPAPRGGGDDKPSKPVGGDDAASLRAAAPAGSAVEPAVDAADENDTIDAEAAATGATEAVDGAGARGAGAAFDVNDSPRRGGAVALARAISRSSSSSSSSPYW